VDADAAEDLAASAPEPHARAFGIRSLRFGTGVLSFATGIDVLALNRAVGFGMDEPVTEAVIDEILDLYRAAGARRFFFQASPFARPAHLAEMLRSRGLEHYNGWMKLYRETDPLPESAGTLEVRAVGPERGPEFAASIATAFDMPDPVRPWLEAWVGRPGWRHYMAFDGAQPVATGALFFKGQCGYLTFASTSAEHRRRGAQSALIAERIRAAREAGCRWVMVETAVDLPEKPAPSFHNVRRLGFQVAYTRPNFIWKAG
jgi:ribosomal protein S18 acetylase RimI-like enzyme